ncbi:MAG TPA: diguanylate cyclase [Pyrinomonadaceae bacterium]|jgi:diguanylate cyclase (GGDEF)-like protein/PAS domain S-box-containing protein
MNQSRKSEFYNWLVVAAGVLAIGFSAYRLPVARLDTRFLLLALVTLGLGSRITMQIPRVNARISLSDTFIFLTILLFGGEAAILLAAAEALCGSLGFAKKRVTVLFNTSVMACSTFMTVWVLRFGFGTLFNWAGEYSALYILALCVMALVQYGANSSLVAVGSALKHEESIWLSWRNNFLWTSLTFFAGASAAGIIARLIDEVGFYALIAATPIIAIVYFTYWTYLKNIEAAAAQAEQARAHVEELNRYIAEQERISKALQETEEHFRNAFDYAAIGMALVSLQGQWLRVNRSLGEIVGYREEELLASTFQAITHDDDLTNELANLYRLVQGGELTCQMEKRYLHKEGNIVWALNSVSLVRDNQDNPMHFIFQIQDITERKRAEAALQSVSLVDELTGLYNRRGFLTVAEQYIAAVHRSGKGLIVLYADLDGLKQINDTLGHMEGDRALMKTAEILKDTFRAADIIARLGGDEFTVLATVAQDENADILVTRLNEKLGKYNALGMCAYDLSISMGVAHFDAQETRSIEELLVRADAAMYEDKRNKKLNPPKVDQSLEADLSANEAVA